MLIVPSKSSVIANRSRDRCTNKLYEYQQQQQQQQQGLLK